MRASLIYFLLSNGIKYVDSKMKNTMYDAEYLPLSLNMIIYCFGDALLARYTPNPLILCI